MKENMGAFEEKNNMAVPEVLPEATGPARGGKRLAQPDQGRRKKVGIVVGVAAGVLAAAYLGLGAWVLGAQRFYPNTSVNGIECGGMTVQELAARLNENAEQARSSSVSFVLPDGMEIAHIAFDDVPQVDHTPCAEQAFYEYGTAQDNILTAGAKYLHAILAPEELSVGTTAEVDDALYALTRVVCDSIPADPVEFSAEVTQDGRVNVTKPMDGRRLIGEEPDETIEAMLRSAYFGGGEITQITLEPVSEDDAQGVYEIVPAQTVDLAAEREKLVGEKVNASYDVENEKIVPSRVGVHFTLADLQSAYDAAAPCEIVSVKAQVEFPEVTTEQLEECLFRDVLSTYTTKVGGAPGRHKNVQLTAERITGQILNAGDTMKYGPLVTPFTAANGYSPAPGYLNGKTVDMIGGGACQASSTLYAAVLYANLEIVQRVNHGYASDYIGLGLDATVAEGGPEFEFRNDTLYPIKVQADFFTKDKKDYIKITILGTKTDDHYVKMVSEVLSTTPYEEEIIETDELAPGERKVEQTAYTGYVVKTYRNIYAGNGTLLSSTYEATSRYKSRNRIVLVGKAAPAVDPTPVPDENGGTTSPGETELPSGADTEAPVDPGVTPPAENTPPTEA